MTEPKKEYLKKELSTTAIDDIRISLSVQTRKLSPEPVCDFCGRETPIYVYAATKMSTGEERDCWRWCACLGCSTLIDLNDWDALRARVAFKLQEMVPGIPKKLATQAVDLALAQFHEYAVTDGGATVKWKSFKVGFRAAGGPWLYNKFRFAEEDQAVAYAQGFARRWTWVKEIVVHLSEDEPNTTLG